MDRMRHPNLASVWCLLAWVVQRCSVGGANCKLAQCAMMLPCSLCSLLQVSFMGLCTLPPCILTGVWAARVADAAGGGALCSVVHCSKTPGCMQTCSFGLLHNCAEYCSRGSLFDVLQQATADPQQAAELTWPLRLSLVSALGWAVRVCTPAACLEGAGRQPACRLRSAAADLRSTLWCAGAGCCARPAVPAPLLPAHHPPGR